MRARVICIHYPTGERRPRFLEQSKIQIFYKKKSIEEWNGSNEVQLGGTEFPVTCIITEGRHLRIIKEKHHLCTIKERCRCCTIKERVSFSLLNFALEAQLSDWKKKSGSG